MKRLFRWPVTWLLALIVAGAAAGDASAAVYWKSGQTFEIEPRFNSIPNTDVYYVRNAPGFDLYRYANRWYLVDQGNWYRSTSWRGPFISVEFASVPEEVTYVPSNYQRYWDVSNDDYRDRDRDWSDGSHASARTFTKKPKMSRITNTGVTYATRMTGFDLYRFRSTWYLVDDGEWFRSDRWQGPYLSARARSVPREVLNVPMEYRRAWASPASYPRRRDGVGYWASGRTFTVQPRMTPIPNMSITYLRDDADYDLYRFGNSWYLADDGGWYRASTWRGPFVSIQIGTVPRDVLRIPYRYRRYWSDTD